jgi:hypothetical protein
MVIPKQESCLTAIDSIDAVSVAVYARNLSVTIFCGGAHGGIMDARPDDSNQEFVEIK